MDNCLETVLNFLIYLIIFSYYLPKHSNARSIEFQLAIPLDIDPEIFLTPPSNLYGMYSSSPTRMLKYPSKAFM